MNQINIHTLLAIQTGISKKTPSVSWLSDEAVRNKKSFENKKINWDKDFKKYVRRNSNCL